MTKVFYFFNSRIIYTALEYWIMFYGHLKYICIFGFTVKVQVIILHRISNHAFGKVFRLS